MVMVNTKNYTGREGERPTKVYVDRGMTDVHLHTYFIVSVVF